MSIFGRRRRTEPLPEDRPIDFKRLVHEWEDHGTRWRVRVIDIRKDSCVIVLEYLDRDGIWDTLPQGHAWQPRRDPVGIDHVSERLQYLIDLVARRAKTVMEAQSAQEVLYAAFDAPNKEGSP